MLCLTIIQNHVRDTRWCKMQPGLICRIICDIFVKTDLFNFCVLLFSFFFTDENQHIFCTFFLVDSKFYTYMSWLWHVALPTMALPVNIAQMKYSISVSTSMPAKIFFYVSLSVWWPLTGPDMLAFCVFHSSLRTRWCAACLSGRSEMSCMDANCWCLIFRVKKFHRATCAAENKLHSSSLMPECIR